MVVSVIYHLLREFMQDHGGKLPRKLHLNLGKILDGGFYILLICFVQTTVSVRTKIGICSHGWLCWWR